MPNVPVTRAVAPPQAGLVLEASGDEQRLFYRNADGSLNGWVIASFRNQGSGIEMTIGNDPGGNAVHLGQDGRIVITNP